MYACTPTCLDVLAEQVVAQRLGKGNVAGQRLVRGRRVDAVRPEPLRGANQKIINPRPATGDAMLLLVPLPMGSDSYMQTVTAMPGTCCMV